MTTRTYTGPVPGRVHLPERTVKVTPGASVDVSDAEAKVLDALPDEWAAPKAAKASKSDKTTSGDEPNDQEPTP